MGVTGMFWPTEAQIDSERQHYLTCRRAVTAHIESGVYPFKDVKLSRADIECLLATREDVLEPVERGGDERQGAYAGLDLRGALLQQADLSNLPLAHMLGGRSWLVCPSLTEEQRDLASAQMERADLGGAHLERSFLGGARMEECLLGGAHLEGDYMEGAHLEGANLVRAYLEGANLAGASLGGMPVPADFLKRVRHWDKHVLTPANLQGAFFNDATTLEDDVLGDEQFGFVSLADVHWGGVNLSVVEWEV